MKVGNSWIFLFKGGDGNRDLPIESVHLKPQKNHVLIPQLNNLHYLHIFT